MGGVGAPVRDYSGRVVAALGVGFIHLSVGPDQMKEIVKQVIAAAAAISADAGYKGKTFSG